MDINEAFRPTVAGDLRMPTVFVALPVVAVAAMRAIAERLSTLAPVAPSATGSGSAVRADVTSAAAGAQNGALTLRAAADRYARRAVVGPSPFSTGNTMIMLDQGGDSGDIVGQRVIPIGPEDTCASVHRDVGQAGADMLTAHLPALLAGNIGAGTYPNLGSFTNNRFGRNQRPDSAKQMSIPKAAVCTIAGNVFDDGGTPVRRQVLTRTPHRPAPSQLRAPGCGGAALRRSTCQLSRPRLLRATARTVERRPQAPGACEVLPRRTPEMGIIDWDQPPRVVHDWVRALTARAHSPCFVVIG